MKNLITVLLLLSLEVSAQVNLNFNKRFVECEDKWVAFNISEDSSYSFGFIYIDSEAGLTFNREGSFKNKKDGTYEIKKIPDTNIKVRLKANNVKVAILPKSMLNDLQVEETPEWLKFYKTDLNTAKRQYQWGFMYNGWNECAKAIPFLLKAKELDPAHRGLVVEIAYSYNCLQEYDKALNVLEDEIQRNPSDAYVNKEYIFSAIKTKDINKASKQFYKSIKLIKDDTYNAENCFNIMQYYYTQKDKKNFNKWYKELQKWPNSNTQITKYAELMKKEL